MKASVVGLCLLALIAGAAAAADSYPLESAYDHSLENSSKRTAPSYSKKSPAYGSYKKGSKYGCQTCWDRTDKRPQHESDCLAKGAYASMDDIYSCVGYPTWSKKDHRHWQQHSHDKYPDCDCYLPSVYEFVSNNPNLTIAKALIDDLGLATALSGPFTGTLLIPTDAAFAAYQAKMAPEVSGSTDVSDFLLKFFQRLLSYHFLMRRVYAPEWESVTPYSTVYWNQNGFPHKVTFVSKNGSVGLMDEQMNFVTFDKVDQIVLGGGVVDTINSVLQPNDVYPSLTAALEYNAAIFSNITTLLSLADTIFPGLLESLETTPGTLAGPSDAAFEGVDLTPIYTNPNFGRQILYNHFCEFNSADRLLYIPFKKSPGQNPCQPWLVTKAGNKGYNLGLSYNYVVPPVNQPFAPPKMWIEFLTGSVLPGGTTSKDKAPIVLADITTPIHSIVVINKLLIPPVGLPKPAPTDP